MRAKTAIFAVILAAAMFLSSCGIILINGSNVPARQTETERARETEPVTDAETRAGTFDTTSADALKSDSDELLSKLSVVNAKGTRIVVAAVDTTFLTGDGSETVLTSDRVERFNSVSQKLDADIDVKTFTESELMRQLAEAVKEGAYFADVLAVPQSMVGYLASEGLIESLRTVPKFDMTAGYFSADSINAMTAGHEIYGVSGEGCFEPEKTYAVYFNTALAESLGLDLYGLVSEGKWTLDEYSKAAEAALNAGKKPTVCSPSVDINEMLLYGSGFDFTVNAVDKTPAAVTFGEDFAVLCEKFAAMPAAERPADAEGDFLKGEALFFIGTLNAAEAMSSSELVWGLLPSPKLGEGSDYSSYLKHDAAVLCIPKYQGDLELSGDFIEALFASSYKYMKYDYLYYYLTKVLRDNGSVNSLKIILNGGNYDFVNIMRSGFPTLYANTAGAFAEIVKGELSLEDYAAREDEVKEYLEKWFPVKGR